MQSWATYDPVAYRADMDRAYHEVAASMHDTATKELVGLAYMRALANTAATSKDVFEFVPLPATQAVAKAAFIAGDRSQISSRRLHQGLRALTE